MGLELGLIQGPDTPWYTWDGITRSMSDWNKNLTLREAFRVSAVPAYQELVRHIGKERMKDFLEKLNYGTKDMSAGLDCFWLSPSHSIKISADQQVELLKMLLQGKLPFSSRNIAILRDVMHYKKTDKGILYGKTGTGVDEKGNYQIGWYVGFVESEHTTYVFACNIIGGEKPMGRTARAIVEEILKQKGIL